MFQKSKREYKEKNADALGSITKQKGHKRLIKEAKNRKTLIDKNEAEVQKSLNCAFLSFICLCVKKIKSINETSFPHCHHHTHSL